MKKPDILAAIEPVVYAFGSTIPSGGNSGGLFNWGVGLWPTTF